MKIKYLMLVFPLLFLTGCNNEYQVSDLKIDDGSIIGVFKNNSNKTCDSVSIDVEINSGSLSDKEIIYITDDVKPGETINIDKFCYDCKSYGKLDDVKVKVLDIDCNEEVTYDEDDDDEYDY